jgi:hypothetical protein
MSETIDEFIAAVHDRLTPDEHRTAVQLAADARARLANLYAAQAPELPDPFSTGTLDDWLDAKITAQQDHELLTRRRNLLVEFIAQADNRARMAQPDTNDILRAYHRKLTELLSEAAELVDQLDGANSAEAAVSKDVAPHWKRLASLARDYEQLRSAQLAETPAEVAIQARPTVGGEPHASDLYIRNLDEVWPSWRQPSLTPKVTHVHGGSADRVEPWPADPVSLLIWLTSSSAEAWIPTVPQLQQLWRQRRERLNPAPEPLRRRPDTAPTIVPQPYSQLIRKIETAPSGQ